MNCIYGDKGECPVRRLGMQACERRFRNDCRSCEKVGGDEPDEMPVQSGECGRDGAR